MDLIPPINHLILIPAVLFTGFWLGWSFGSKQIKKAWDKAEKRRLREEDDG